MRSIRTLFWVSGFVSKVAEYLEEETTVEEQQVYNSTELFIFSREDNLDTIMDAFFECYGVPKHDAGNQLWLKNNKHSVNNVVFLPDMARITGLLLKGRGTVCAVILPRCKTVIMI